MTDTLKSPPRDFREALASFFSLTGLLLLVIFGTMLFLDQTLTNRVQDELMSPEGATNWIWFYGGLSFTLGLIGPLLTGFLILCAWRFPNESVAKVAGRSLSYLVREEMRVLGQSLLWGLLFIIPGIIRFFQASFVSYVVLFDQNYQRGEVDALNRSWRFVKKVWARLLGLLILFGAILPLIMTTVDEWRSFEVHPLTAIPLMLVEFTFLILFQWFVLNAWDKAQERLSQAG